MKQQTKNSLLSYIIILFFIATLHYSCNKPNSYMGLEAPIHKAELFAPEYFNGKISCICFTPNGKEVYYVENTPVMPDYNVIKFMKQENEIWSEPQTAPFSGKYRDWNINLSPDGNQLFFTSRRPINEGSEVKKDNDIWAVKRINGKWEKPYNLGKPVNTELMDCYASCANNGNIYFHRFNTKDGHGGADIYFSQFKNGKYSTPQNLGTNINSNKHDWDVVVSPDEKFLIFASVGREDSKGKGDLYISYKEKNGTWSKAINMGDKVNSEAHEICPSLSPDGKCLFFTSFRNQSNVFWIDLSGWKV